MTKDGKLLAMEIDFVIDGGAYCTLSPVVLSRGTIHAAGPYVLSERADSAAARSRRTCRRTARSEALARRRASSRSSGTWTKWRTRLALTPEEFRRRNFIHEGETTATSQVIREQVDMDHLLDRAFELSDYHAKRERFARENEQSAADGALRRNQETRASASPRSCTAPASPARAKFICSRWSAAEATAEGKVRILAASTEIGQGTNTIFSQIAAEALGLDFDSIEDRPAGYGTRAQQRANRRVAHLHGRRQAGGVGGDGFEADACRQRSVAAESILQAEFQEGVSRLHREVWPTEDFFDSINRRRMFTGTTRSIRAMRTALMRGPFTWPKFQSMTLTYEARVEDFVAVQEVGRVINPVLAAGQIEGGVAQAIGFTLFENVVWKDGRMANDQMTNYIMPTAADIPPIRVYFEENPYAYGPGGAKGIGELPMDGAAPAILNAIENATGVSFNQIPLMPERLMEPFVERESS